MVVGAHHIGALPKVNKVHTGSSQPQHHLGKSLFLGMHELTHSNSRLLFAVISGTGAGGLGWACPLADLVLVAARCPWDTLSVEMVEPAVNPPLLDKLSDTIDGVCNSSTNKPDYRAVQRCLQGA
jgi:hypothetical protein